MSTACLHPLSYCRAPCARLPWANAWEAVPATLPLALTLGIGDFFTLIHVSFCDIYKRRTDPLQSQRSKVIFQL